MAFHFANSMHTMALIGPDRIKLRTELYQQVIC